MALPKVFLEHCIFCFEKVNFGSWKYSFVCLHLSVFFHLFDQWKLTRSLMFFLKKVVFGFSRFCVFYSRTVNVRNPNVWILAFWKIVWLLNRLDFERRLKSELYRLDFERSVH